MGEDVRAALESAGVPFEDNSDLRSAVASADVVYQTRIQRERFATEEEYRESSGIYLIDEDVMDSMKRGAILMHPLPRVDEIDPSVDADHRAAYFRQAHNGMYVRMALLHLLLAEHWAPEGI